MRQQGNTVYQEKTVNYIEGNTVRKLQPEPKRRSEETHQELVRRQEQERELKERQRNARAAARRNQERALAMSPGYVLFLAGAMAVMVAVLGSYLYLQSEVSTRMKHVAALENEVLDLKTDNDAEQKRINTSVDLESIRQKAIGELGMVYPTEDQIIYYEMDTNDYMNQYEDIPEK